MYVEKTVRHMLTAAAVQEGRPKLEEVKLSERQFGVGVAERKQTGLLCTMSHRRGSNAFITVKGAAVLKNFQYEPQRSRHS